MISLVICDDHELVREALSAVLGAFDDIAVVGIVESPDALSDVVSRHDPDVVLVDVRLGEQSGIEAARRVRELNRRTKVVMLTSFADDQVLVEAHDSGAVGFLLKSGRPHEIVEAVRAVAAGARLIDGDEVDSARRRLQEL
ncbi:MAG: response regulator [Ilumatobacteraceae bacterium]